MTEHLTSTSWVIFYKALSVNVLCPAQFVKCPTKRKIWKDICPVNKEKLFPALLMCVSVIFLISSSIFLKFNYLELHSRTKLYNFLLIFYKKAMLRYMYSPLPPPTPQIHVQPHSPPSPPPPPPTALPRSSCSSIDDPTSVTADFSVVIFLFCQATNGPFHVTDITSGEQNFGNETIFYELIFCSFYLKFVQISLTWYLTSSRKETLISFTNAANMLVLNIVTDITKKSTYDVLCSLDTTIPVNWHARQNFLNSETNKGAS